MASKTPPAIHLALSDIVKAFLTSSFLGSMSSIFKFLFTFAPSFNKPLRTPDIVALTSCFFHNY